MTDRCEERLQTPAADTQKPPLVPIRPVDKPRLSHPLNEGPLLRGGDLGALTSAHLPAPFSYVGWSSLRI